MPLLSREEFAKQVFERDKHTCVIPGCGRPAADPHHIMERRLFCDGDPLPGGYDLNNGASLCEQHHIHAEEGYFPPQALRRWLGIPTVLPALCKKDVIYDKWGNEIGKAPHAHAKYPKTPYLNFSPGYENGDRYIDTKDLLGKPLAITVKKDGSCVTLSRDTCGARNGHDAEHPSFNMLKARHAALKDAIPEGIQLFGEWLYARHSIHYTGPLALRDYFQVFAVYDQNEQLFLGQDDVQIMCDDLDLVMVERAAVVCYYAEWELIQGISVAGEAAIARGEEGVVVKSMYPYHYTQFAVNAAKYVRENHVQTSEHWRKQAIVKNEVQPPA